MIVVSTLADLRAAVRPRRSGSIGFVPTMGALHPGHATLLAAAREAQETVVLSIFVNPTQFDQKADLDLYPQPLAQDLELAREAGVDIVYTPTVEEMYPAGYATTVSVAGRLTETLEGAARGRGHFDGVTTVVTKLLLAVLPDTVYFGAKDAQQVAVVTHMVSDLGIPVTVQVVPTSRDDDGLARSSRNTRLSTDERARALAVPRSLQEAQACVSAGERDAEVVVAAASAVLVAAELDIEYVAVVDPHSLDPVPVIDGSALLVIAVRAGNTRLIDNTMLVTGPPA